MPAERGPADRGRDAAERFAAAVDRGRSPRLAGGDADLARELGIVARLRSQDGTYASHAEATAMLTTPRAAEHSPTADEKARARQQLMALLAEPQARADVVAFPSPTAAAQTAPIPVVAAAVDVAESAEIDSGIDSGADEPLAAVTPLAGRRSRHSRHARVAPPARRSAGLLRRAGLVGSAALLVLVAFVGVGVFVSRDALPGQTLYPLKRAAEAAGLAMTFDDEARARRNLELAAIRLSEVEQLVALSDGSAIDPQLVREAMTEFDVAASEGSRALLADAGRTGTLQAWAATQSARISALRPDLPVRAVPAADTSIALLDRLLGREPSPDTRTPTADAESSDEVEAPSAPSRRTPETDSTAGGESTPQGEAGLPALGTEDGPLAEDPATGRPAPASPPADDVQRDDNARLPLPLPGAPIALPPLLPGMPGITLG